MIFCIFSAFASQSQNKNVFISDIDFIHHCSQFSNELQNILQSNETDKNQQKKQIEQLFTNFLEIINIYESSESYRFSSFYELTNTEKIQETKNVLNNFLQNKISIEDATLQLYQLLFEFENAKISAYNETLSKTNTLFSTLICLVFLAGIFIIFYVRKKNELLKAKISSYQNELLSRSIINAQEEDRIKLSSEIHDTVGQDIKAEQLFVTQLVSSIKPNLEQKETINKIEYLQEKISKGVRQLIKNLSVPNFQKEKLRNIINDFCIETSAFNHIDCKFSIKDDVNIDKKNQFSLEKKQHIFRIIQESVNNAVKHSECSEIVVFIREDFQNKLAIFITDDGKGFDIKNVSKTSYGIRSMNERAKIINAKLTIESDSECGTTVKLEL